MVNDGAIFDVGIRQSNMQQKSISHLKVIYMCSTSTGMCVSRF